MGWKLIAVTAAFLTLLLFGCAGEQPKTVAPEPQAAFEPQPQPAPQNASVQPEPQKPPIPLKDKGRITCSIETKPTLLYAGEYADVEFSVYSGVDTEFTFSCGDELRLISTGGLISGNRLCQFGEPGEQQVAIFADGEKCAETNVTVLESGHAAQKCHLDADSIQRRINETTSSYFSGTVWFSGFANGSVISWGCDEAQMNATLGASQGSAEVFCIFQDEPENDYILISIGGMPCGRISTRPKWPYP